MLEMDPASLHAWQMYVDIVPAAFKHLASRLICRTCGVCVFVFYLSRLYQILSITAPRAHALPNQFRVSL